MKQYYTKKFLIYRKMEKSSIFSTFRFSCTENALLLENLPYSTDSVNKIPHLYLCSIDRANRLIIP